jgi:hypothetical protein
MSEVDKITADTFAWLEPLLAIVSCPRTGRALRPATVPELGGLLGPQRRCSIREGMVGALVAEGSPVAYPIIGSIVDFLEQDALYLSDAPESLPRNEDSPSAAIKNSVKAWYDLFGWKKGADGRYGDTALFSQVDRTAHAFYEMDSHLQFLDCLPGGTFLLDAASGPVAHPEYKSYSRHYKYRVCVDLSYTALQEAAAKIGRQGFYCMADLCHLPFRDNVFDAVVSGYTIQHIPESDQHRPSGAASCSGQGRQCCIMTDSRLPHGSYYTSSADHGRRSPQEQPPRSRERATFGRGPTWSAVLLPSFAALVAQRLLLSGLCRLRGDLTPPREIRVRASLRQLANRRANSPKAGEGSAASVCAFRPVWVDTLLENRARRQIEA